MFKMFKTSTYYTKMYRVLQIIELELQSPTFNTLIKVILLINGYHIILMHFMVRRFSTPSMNEHFRFFESS